MIVYVPCHDRKRTYAEINTAKARLLSGKTVEYLGTLYNGEVFFGSPSGCAAYWQRNYKAMESERVFVPERAWMVCK